MVDDTLKSFSAIVSGGNPKLEIFNPKGVLVNDQSTVETIVNLSKMKVCE